MGEVMIGGKIYSLDKDFYDYEIISDYENSLLKINNGEDITEDPNINSINKSSGICRNAGYTEDFMLFPNNSNRRVKRKLTFQNNNFWGTHLVTRTEIISYKKNSNGSWSRSASQIGIRNDTSYNQANCARLSFTRTDNHSSTRNRRSRTARISQVNPSYQYSIEQWGNRFKGTYFYGGTSSIKYY